MNTPSAGSADRLPVPAYGTIFGEIPSPFAASCGLFHTVDQALHEIRQDLQLLCLTGLTPDQIAQAERIHAAAVALRNASRDLSTAIAKDA